MKAKKHALYNFTLSETSFIVVIKHGHL